MASKQTSTRQAPYDAQSASLETSVETCVGCGCILGLIRFTFKEVSVFSRSELHAAVTQKRKSDQFIKGSSLCMRRYGTPSDYMHVGTVKYGGIVSAYSTINTSPPHGT